MNKKRILVIDDNAGVTRMLKEALNATGLYEVREENTGWSGLEMARQFQPDLVLLDLMMPIMNGGEVARRIAAEPTLKATRIVFLSGLVSENDSTGHKLRNDGHRCLPKSISVRTLMACMAEELKLGKSRNEIIHVAPQVR